MATIQINIPFVYEIGETGYHSGVQLNTVEDCENEVLAEIEAGVLSETEVFMEVQKPKDDLPRRLIYFGFNYPHNFIQKAFEGKVAQHIINHLQDKFGGMYETYGARAVFGMFFVNLDNENQATLIDWIDNNYKG